MKKSICITLWFVLMLLTVCVNPVFGQLLMKEVPLKQQIDNSNLVIEGEVVAKTSFFGGDNNIYTLNTIDVYKVFKGEPLSQVKVITKGGSVGSKFQVVTHTLELSIGDLGVFNLSDNVLSSKPVNHSESKLFKVYSDSQGFYKYNIYDDVVVNPFKGKRGITDAFYSDILDYTKTSFKEIKAFNVKHETSKLNTQKSALVPSQISFTPTITSAGTGATIVITIAGGATGNFGSQPGKVSFRNADSGGLDQNDLPDYIDALDTQILNWSTNSITVEVPSRAGTGNIRVTDASQNVVDSSADLQITYSELNVNATFNIEGDIKTYAYPTRLLDNDGSGGYVLRMETSFDAGTEHPGAKASYLTALDTWRCETGVNFNIGPVTDVDQSVKDDINVIRFDSGNELDEGVLGQTSYSFNGCGTSVSNYEVFVEEIDMVFDDDEAWYFGPVDPGPGFEIDFQSVALHELGHAYQLGHVIEESNDVMHFSIGLGQVLRELSQNNKVAGNNVQDRSESAVPAFSCFLGKAPMSEYDCELSVTEEELDKAISIYPNPSNGKFYIKNRSSIGIEKIVIYDISGRQVLEQHRLDNLSTEGISLKVASKGVYFINLFTEIGIITSKLLLN